LQRFPVAVKINRRPQNIEGRIAVNLRDDCRRTSLVAASAACGESEQRACHCAENNN